MRSDDVGIIADSLMQIMNTEKKLVKKINKMQDVTVK